MNAVIFDCDGVLVDSEALSELAWTRALAGFGFRFEQGEFERCIGRTRHDTHAYLSSRGDLPGFEEVSAAVDREIRPLLDTIEAFPDAVATVQELALNGIPLAVASSSQRADLDVKLDRAGLRRYFDVTVAGDEVAAGKPAPDLFLQAAHGLGIAPGRCLVVEDSAPGADAAEAAGMRVVTVARAGGLIGGRPSVDRLDAGLILTWLS